MVAVTDRQFGIGVESTYGTYEAPTIFPLVSEADITENPPAIIDFGGLRAGLFNRSQDDIAFGPRVGGRGFWRQAVVTAGGGITEVLYAALGANTQSGTDPLTETVTVGTLNGRHLTVQGVWPTVDGSDTVVKSGLGGKITRLQLSCDIGQPMRMFVEVDFRQVVESETKAAASYTVGAPLLWHLSTLTVNSVAVKMKGWTLDITNPFDFDRTFLVSGGLKDEPTEMGRRTFMLTLRGLEFRDDDHWDRIMATTAATRMFAVSFETTAVNTAHKLTLTASKAMYTAGSLTGLRPDQFKHEIASLPLELLAPTAGTTPLTIAYVHPA